MLYNKDLYDPILGGNGKSSDKFDAKWKKMNWKTDAIIRQWLDFSSYPHVEGETDTQKMWNKVKDLYERKNMQNNVCLIKKLDNMKYKDIDSMKKHKSVFYNTMK